VNAPTRADRLRGDAAWLAIAAAVLVSLAFAFFAVFGTPENMAAPAFGTAWAPYSDALGPWFEGGLTFLFGLPPPVYLYRPTIGLFWGSILGATGRAEMIPMLFTAMLLGAFAAFTLSAENTRVRNAVIVAAALFALTFRQTWHTLHISSTAVDLPALALTTSGVLLLLWGRGRHAYAALLIGCVYLGIAAAIRGPMMLAAILMIGIRVLLVERTPLAVIAAAVALFLAPLVVDALLQRHFGVINNGVMAMYCFYSDPSHAWSPACNVAYLARKPSGGLVLQEYLQFLLSPAGRSHVFDSMSWRISRDLAPVLRSAALALLGGAGLLASWTEKTFLRSAWSSPLLRAVLVVALLAGLRALGANPPWNALALCAALLVAAAAMRLWSAAMCMVGYLSSTLYLCLVGLLNDRLQHTFSVCLYVGLGLLIMESARPAVLQTSRIARVIQQAAPAVLGMAVLFLYAGNYLVPSRLRDTYRLEVQGRPGVAIKVAGDHRINRSLYYSGERHLFYTAHDALEVGAVRKYGKLANSMQGNASFVQPNAFLD
jgi:hypothetical protein